MNELQVTSVKRIIVRGTNWVGDAMMTMPALRELRRLFPDAHITLATRSWAKGLFVGAEFVDELQINDGRGLRSFFQQVRAWRSGRFDLAILLTNSFQSALVAALAGIPVRIGYAADGFARGFRYSEGRSARSSPAPGRPRRRTRNCAVSRLDKQSRQALACGKLCC